MKNAFQVHGKKDCVCVCVCVCVTQKNRVAAHNKHMYECASSLFESNVTIFSGENEERQINARYYNRFSIRNSN